MFRLLDSFLRSFFALLYHQFSWLYDTVAAVVSAGRWKNWIRSPLPYLEGPAVLEIGHGPGHLLLSLAERGINATGLDESRWMNRLAFKRIKNTTTTPKILNGYAQYLPFKSSSFNQVICTFPAEFILDPETLREVKRVLVTGGCFLVVPFAWITGQRFIDRLARLFYHLTNQAPDWNERFLLPFGQAGFETRYEFIEIDQSKVLLIQAFKVV